jgi:hypothetical protein
MRLHHVKEGELTVNWAYSPAGLTRLGIWEGLTRQDAGIIYNWQEHEALATGESIGEYNQISVIITNPGIYTIVFFNPPEVQDVEHQEEIVLIPNTDKTTTPFRQGGRKNTWIYVRAHQDYVIAATAGRVSVSAFVRQVPGFPEPLTADRSSWITNEVSILSWRAP